MEFSRFLDMIREQPRPCFSRERNTREGLGRETTSDAEMRG